MTFRFVNQPLKSGLYEPEGLYLSLPFSHEPEDPCRIVQHWGDEDGLYTDFTYNGVPLRGNTGLDFSLPPRIDIVSTDQGRIVEISVEPGGFERYIKVEHRWGESLYAYIGRVSVDSGQLVQRGERLAESSSAITGHQLGRLHFAIRVTPFNRFDGFGGYTDPLPYLNPAELPPFHAPDDGPAIPPHPMSAESPTTRRP